MKLTPLQKADRPDFVDRTEEIRREIAQSEAERMSETTTLPASPDGPKTEPLMAGMTRVQPGDTIRLGDVVCHPGLNPLELDASCVGEVLRGDASPVWRPKRESPPEAEAIRVLNSAIDRYRYRERLDGPMPTLRVSREAWDAIIKPAEARGELRNDPKYAGITEYRGCPVVVVSDSDRPGIWAEAVNPSADRNPRAGWTHNPGAEAWKPQFGPSPSPLLATIDKLRAELAEVTQQRDSHLGVCRSIALKVRDVYGGDPSATLEKKVAWVCEKLQVFAERVLQTPDSAHASYRLLETGEIAQEGDQFRVPLTDDWRSVKETGFIVGFGERSYRRPITGGAGLHEAATCPQEPPETNLSPDAPPMRDLAGELTQPGILARIERFEECGLLLSELPAAEARLVIAALATVFSV